MRPTTAWRWMTTFMAAMPCWATPAAQPGNAITVVPVYEGMVRYADAVAASPAADRQALWQQHVLDPYQSPYDP